MYCDRCGAFMPDRSSFCPSCGSPAGMDGFGGADYGYGRRAKPSVSFGRAISLFFSHYADFKGRSRRSEYWWASLFCNLVSIVLTAVLGDLAWIWSLVILIPTLAINVRRLHDIGKSGWWYLLILIPLVGSIILLIFCCQDSERGRNKWGRSPKY